MAAHAVVTLHQLQTVWRTDECPFALLHLHVICFAGIQSCSGYGSRNVSACFQEIIIISTGSDTIPVNLAFTAIERFDDGGIGSLGRIRTRRNPVAGIERVANKDIFHAIAAIAVGKIVIANGRNLRTTGCGCGSSLGVVELLVTGICTAEEVGHERWYGICSHTTVAVAVDCCFHLAGM